MRPQRGPLASRPGRWGVLGRQLRSPNLLLAVTAAISATIGSTSDAIIIGVILLASVALGFVNEYRAERAAASLHDLMRHTVAVVRDGHPARVDVKDVVPGDVVRLAAGVVVPADIRLLEVASLDCDESVLTGESSTVDKDLAPVGPGAGVADLTSCALMGTVVSGGTATGVVVATGARAEFGRIALELGERQPETDFQVGLRQFSTLLLQVAAALTALILLTNLLLHRSLLESLLFSLAIAIGITPQLLPAIVSVSLAAGSRELARRKVLVKRLVTIEDLGNIRLLFTDKTGTLTEGIVTFAESLDVAGVASPGPLALGRVCNEATLTAGGPVGGNVLDQALLAAAVVDGSPAYELLGLLPFDHDRQLVSATARTPTGSFVLVTKGAPEAVLRRCVDVPEEATSTAERLFAEGARVVAVATREVDDAGAPRPEDERDLHLAGFLTFTDPPKADAGVSIAKLAALDIAVKIITGDNGTVAAKVCGDIGIELGAVLTGTQIESLDDDELSDAIPATTVFARVSPDQKSRIIKVARRRGDDVAFLGDGVNDAVALHAADVGISVDSATDVAKDAADIVLLDKNLGVLADGVVEGRRIFANTMKYVLMATSSNFGNMFSAAGASLFLSFLPMLPSQILLNNLLYDVGQLAIPTDNVDPETVARPAAWDIGFVRRFMAVFGPVSSIFDFLTFFVMLTVLNASHAEFRSGWFIESLATQTLVVFLIRTRRVPFYRSTPSRAMMITPTAMALVGAILPFSPAAHLLGFTTLPVAFFLILVAMVLAYLALVEVVKSRFYARELRRVRQLPVTTHEQRLTRRIRRRAGLFIRHELAHMR